MNKTGKRFYWQRSNQRNERKRYGEHQNRCLLKDESSIQRQLG